MCECCGRKIVLGCRRSGKTLCSVCDTSIRTDEIVNKCKFEDAFEKRRKLVK